jgi:Mlc titration factor MtfA (ptsG expression regulator)
MSVNWLMQRILGFRYRGEPPVEWASEVRRLSFADTLTDAETRRLVQLSRMFESVVRFDGRHGVEVDDRMRRVIILHACRLVLGLGYEPYRFVHRVTIAEDTFVLDTRDGTVRLHGAAESGGHVAFSWREVEAGAEWDDDGRNVVYHEFAHVLDGYDGVVDGRPEVGDERARAVWAESVGSAYRRRRRGSRRRQLIDEYGATSPVEFFAEATEVFFEKPIEMAEHDPPLYAAMTHYFRQDPAADLRAVLDDLA